LVDIAPVAPSGGGKAFICLSGAEANENAVKIARLYTGRAKVVARTQSYHGATLAMLSLSGDPRRAPFEPGLPGVLRVASPSCYRCPFDKEPTTCGLACADDLETVLAREDPETVAAVILEGIVGANGVYVPPPGYFRRIREICDRHGVLLIADEVLSGMGRTGRWFAVDHDGVAPDIVTVGKGVTGGYAPGGAVVVNERIARHFEDETLLCGLTSYAHPLVCAAMVAAIETLRAEALVDRAAALGAWWRPRLEGLKALPLVGEVRGLGLLWALELVDPRSPAGRARPPLPADACRALAAALRARHVHLHRRENLFYLAPPLVSDEAFLAEATGVLAAALAEVTA
jgi:taurine--2-oxoglutarate transaminase